MNKQTFLFHLEDLLELDKGSLKGDEPLTDVPWDSLAVVSFIAMVDQHLEISIKPENIAKAKTIADLTRLVSEKLDG